MRDRNLTFKIFRSVTALSLALALVPGCSGGGGFGAGELGKATGAKKGDSSSGGKQLGDSEPLDDEADDDVLQGDEPAEVAGAFLTCFEDPALTTTSPEDVGVGCAVRKEAAKIDLSGVTLDWTSVVDGVSRGALPCTAMPQDNDYHATMVIKRAELAKTQIRVKVTSKDGKAGELMSQITAKPATGGGASDNVVAIGTDFNLQLGNGSWDWAANVDCIFAFQTQRLYNEQLVIPVTVVSATATLTIEIPEICGVSTNTDTVEIRKLGLPVASAAIPKKARTFALPETALTAGDYQVVITANSDANYDVDDFVIGKLVLTKTGDVTIGQPADPGL